MKAFCRLPLAVLVLTLVAAAPAAAQGTKIDIPGTGSFLYGEQAGTGGEIGICVQGMYFGGKGPADPDGWLADEEECAKRTGGSPGGGPVEPPCEFPAGCIAQIVEAISGGGEGGGGDPGSPGTPGQRECSGISGPGATCLGTETDYLLLKSPGEGNGEFGICTTQPVPPEGAGYYYGTGPTDPTGGHEAACPTGAPVPPAGEGGTGTTAPADEDGDGVADSGDRCPRVSGSTSDGCPPQSGGSGSRPSESGSEQSSARDGSAGSPPPSRSRDADPPELPRVDITRGRLGVSRTGRTTVPLRCETVRTACKGVLRLTATRRSSSGRRVRVVVAKAQFLVQPGRKLKRKVRLTRAGRRMLANRGRVATRAQIKLSSSSGSVVTRERVVLRRR